MQRVCRNDCSNLLFEQVARTVAPRALELLEVLNGICFVLLDMALGQLALTYLGGIAARHQHANIVKMAAIASLIYFVIWMLDSPPSAVVKLLRDNMEQLMGAPAAFRLNKPLASILGNGILLWLNLWSFIFEEFEPLASAGNIGHQLLLVCGHMGLALQLTLMVDLLNLTTWHSHWIYLYFAKLNRQRI